MNSLVVLRSLLALVLASPCASAQSISVLQGAIAKLKPTYFWDFDNNLTSAGAAGPAVLQSQGGGFVADFDGRDSGAQGFVTSKDGLVLSGDPITGGGEAKTEADGTGSIFLLFRSFETIPRGQRFLLSQGSKPSEAHNMLGLFIQAETAPVEPGALALRVGNAQFVVATASELASRGWHFIAFSWDEVRNKDQVRWYFGPVGGDVTRTGAGSLSQRAVVGNDGPFAIGFSEAVDSSAFRDPNQPGALDAFAIFDRELKPEEIKALVATLRLK